MAPMALALFRPCIYGLVDPIEPKHVRYVGMALCERRLVQHSKEARVNKRTTYKLNWIRSLQAIGREPRVVRLENLPFYATRKFAGFVESCYIAALRAVGHQLTNATAGGDGGSTRQGHRNTTAHNQAVSDALQGHTHSEETREKMSARKKGRALSAAHREAIGNALRGKPRPSLIGNTNAARRYT